LAFLFLPSSFVTAATAPSSATATTTTTASAATTGAPASATPASVASATPASGFGHRASFVNNQGAAHHFFSIAGFHSAISFRVIIDFGKAEAAGLIRKFIADQGDYVDVDTLLMEPIRYVRFADAIRQVTKV